MSLPPVARAGHWLNGDWNDDGSGLVPHRWLCTWGSPGDCDRPARWGDPGRPDDGPLFCDAHAKDELSEETHRCPVCGHPHTADVEPELYEEICPECGSDDTGFGIQAYYCDSCGATWMKGT